MTETARRLGRLAQPHARARALAALLAGAGTMLALAAAGMALAPRIGAIVLVWVVIAGVAAAAAWGARRAARTAAPQDAGRIVERTAGARAGSVLGLLAPVAGGEKAGAGTSADLVAAADAGAVRVVERAAPAVHRVLRRWTRAGLVAGAAATAAGTVLFIAAAPASGRAAAFWNPVRALREARAPVRLELDRTAVHRGDSVTATITVAAATRAVLWSHGPGEAWQPRAMTLDSAGRAAIRLGPLQADLVLRAASGRRSSPVRRVTVALPAFLSELSITARFPRYLAREDEPLVPGPDTIPLPAGTEVLTQGTASVALGQASWQRGGSAAAPLRVAGARLSGRFGGASGTWRLTLATRDGSPLEGASPELRLRIVPDSAPLVVVPVPGRDTTLPLSLRQPLVIDARDDHGLAQVAIVSWRVSRTGRVGERVRDTLVLGGVEERAILQTELTLERRGLLPGDTVRFRVEALDNAPVPHRGLSPEFALRLLSLEELRAATRAATREVAAAADSVAAAQRELGDRTRDLSQERARPGGETPAAGRSGTQGSQPGALPFQSTQRAEEVARQQAALQQRIEELSRAVEEIAQAARAAGIGDTAFQQRLREVQEMLQRAVTPELEERLRQLQEALARLDPEAARQALQHLVEAQQELREQLERSQELFRRAAVEGELASLAADARDLREAQQQWNRSAAPRADSAAAAEERALAARAESLVAGLTRADRDLAAGAAHDSTRLAPSRQAATRAAGAMQRAERGAASGAPQEAQQGGEQAARELETLPEDLVAVRDALAGAWRQEALAALDRAMSETAALANRQQQVAEALRRGEGGAGTRGNEAAVEEGVDAVGRQIQDAAGKHALVPPELQAALGYARRQMQGARQQLEQAEPNTDAAGALAEQALDALNATALALARSRSAVAGAKSGSGFAEAVEQLARMAGEQQGLNGDAQGLMPMLGMGGPGALQQLRALAARQRALADQLDRLQAEGGSGAAGPLAQEARDLARQLEAGRLDPQTVARQERLYRRLLDAGRTLSGADPDERQERTSRSALGDSVHVPTPLRTGATGAGARIRYPTWDELVQLTPEQRRLVLEYFRRLNAPRP